MSELPKTDVLVLGSGLTGLRATQVAKENGASVTTLEKENKEGGRVRTTKLTPDQNSKRGLSAEFGPEWVGEDHPKLQKEIRASELELEPHRYAYGLIKDGKVHSSVEDQYTLDFNQKLMAEAQSMARLPRSERAKLAHVPYRIYLLSKGFNPSDVAINGLQMADAYGEDIDHLPALNVLEDIADDVIKGEDAFTIKGGMYRLVEAMAKPLKGNLFLNKEITRVEQDDKGVTAFDADGIKFQADKMIVTLPPAAILNIDWFPKLPEAQVEALKSLKFAQILKLAAVFKERVWDRDDFAVLVDYLQATIYHATQGQEGNKGVLMAYVVGEHAERLARLSAQRQKQEFNKALTPVFGDVSSYIDSVHPVYWPDDPGVKGAYSVYHSGYHKQRRLMAQRHGNVVWAGEHLPKQWRYQGFMEGSLWSADEAVEQLATF